MSAGSKTMPFEVDCPVGLAKALAAIAAKRGGAIDATEFAEAVRLCESCRLADDGSPDDPGSQSGLLPRAVPAGALVLRTPTIAARVVLTAVAGWQVPPESAASPAAAAEYGTLLTAWVCAHGRDPEALALLSEQTAPAIVADLRSRLGCTLAEVQAGLAEIVANLYPEPDVLERWCAEADAQVDAAEGKPATAPQPTDWAGILLALAAETGGTTEQWLQAYEPHLLHELAALRRRRRREIAALDRHSREAPDPEAPKARAARAWNAFETRLLQRRSIDTASMPKLEKTEMKRELVKFEDGRACEIREMTWAELQKLRAEGETLPMEWPLQQQFKDREQELDGLGVSEVRKLAERVYALTFADGSGLAAS